MKILSLLCLIAAIVTCCKAFGVTEPKKCNVNVDSTTPSLMTRSSFMTAIAAGVFTANTGIVSSTMSWAKDGDSELKGTKQDPDFEACLSKCLYDCTKPKGSEQRSRKECLPECKTTCAKTKEQLMLGKPI